MKSGAASGARYDIVPGRHGLVDVIDRTTGVPAEAGVTAILLEPREARELVRWLVHRVHIEGGGCAERPECVHHDVPSRHLMHSLKAAALAGQY
ncbi:hypothetical protein [Rhizobium sp. AN80A]|uniref:hypothetical protein n=1 Tax=Rhizobium sp. AN80A TaxID=3040673 RepID=UPI0024B33611|nr:hypothetical protein [Rhizobium sp. AN80A]